MAQYLTALWSYTAEGNFELSFKEGDKIKLLEKHNDNWWEGELNDEIGFFPANRTTATVVEPTSKDDTSETDTTEQITTDLVKKISISSSSKSALIPPSRGPKKVHSNPYLANQQQQLVDTTTQDALEDEELFEGWNPSYDDDSGTIYYYNKTTEKSQWEKPTNKAQAEMTSEEQKKKAASPPAPKSTLIRWFSRSSKNSAKSQTPPTSCQQDLIFGGYLKLEDNGDIPLVVKICIDQVEKRGLDVVGIYRISGQSTSIQKYKALFNNNQYPDLDNEPDINVITGLLKLYFRELKNPLLTFEYYDRFVEAARLQEYEERMFRMKSMIQVLPVAHYKVFQYLLRHLERVQHEHSINKMEASNLALIFAIGLLRSRHEDVSASILHTDLVSKVVEMVILHVDWFFDKDASTDDEADNSINSSNIIEL